jgi:lipooligosaccharide transport system permease protein
MAFAGIITAYTARLQNETGLSSLFRFGIVPLFLFSGTFFPISQLPGWIQPVAWFTPLWHGVELTRAVALGIRPSFAPAVHIGALVSVLIVGTVISVRFMERRIVS